MTKINEGSRRHMMEYSTNIKLLALDVDGTLTDGKVYIGPGGEMLKAFNIKDGYGLRHLLPKAGISVAIITGRESEMVKIRARELGINIILQNATDKASSLKRLLKRFSLSCEEVAYMGDDLNDLKAMQLCGIKACPADAVREVLAIVDFVSTRSGGDGAVREFIDFLLKEAR